MGLEATTYINGLIVTNPLGTDDRSQGDDHIRVLKSSLKNTFPNLTGAVTPTQTELNFIVGLTSSLQAQLASKAAIAGQVFTEDIAASNLSGTNTGDQDLSGLVHANRAALDLVSGTNTGDQTNITGNAATVSTIDVGDSLSGNGYIKLVGGLILQWGTATASANTATAVSFPISFTNAVFIVVASRNSVIIVEGQSQAIAASNFTLSGFTINNAEQTTDFSYFATGI